MVWEAKAESETAAGPEVVWRLWEDPARWSEWNEDIAWARLEGPFEAGAKARIKFKRGLTLTFTVTELERGRLFTDEARMAGARLGHEHLVERSDERTRIQNRLYFEGPAERLYGLLMGRRMRRSVRCFVERERALAEAASGAKA
jgi:hypothetical protein